MSLLYELYPVLRNESLSDVPNWQSSDKPWEILATDELGLIDQINQITGDEDGVFIHPTAKIGDNVEINGPCYVGPGVEVRHCALLRKGTWLCADSLVGHASEVKNSILLPGAKAPHFNYVGDSILGSGVNLGAGTKLSNVRNDRNNILIQLGDGTRKDSGTYKLGALIGDGSQLGCNVVTNPGVILAPNSYIGPNITVTGWNN